MEQELYITRKENWFDSDPEHDISMEEWIACVKMDPEMRLDNFSEVKLENGETFQYDNPGTAVWVGHSENDIKTTFDFLSGNITVRNPTSSAIEKMKHIAFKLGAKLQGDEGEVFATEDTLVNEPQQVLAEEAKPGALKKLWWKVQHSIFTSPSGK